MKALCSRISAVGDEGEEETVGKRQLDMECASVALVQTVCAAIQLFTGLPPQKDGSVEPEGALRWWNMECGVSRTKSGVLGIDERVWGPAFRVEGLGSRV
eukprot:3005341-Rhodomonas_salina.2